MKGSSLAFNKLFKSVLIAFVINIIAISALSLFVYYFDIAEKAISAIIITISSLCVFFGGVVLARNIESRGLLNGLVLGLSYVALLLILSLAAFGSVSANMRNITRCICIIAAAMLGGVAGINTKSET